MNQIYIRVNQLATSLHKPGRLPLSPTTIWRMVKRGEFPAPIKLSEKCTAWKLADIEAWEKQREASI